VRFQRRIIRQATSGLGQPSVLGLKLSQAILQFAKLLLLACKFDIPPGNIPPCLVALLPETFAFPRSPLQTPPQTPPHHPQG
jgi:hypothetical protein